MAIQRYLAMTAAEIAENSALPEKTGWMACQFSPWSAGLSNLPGSLPPGSLLILNDFTPIDGHDPSVVGAQLRHCVESLQCSGVLLDFQRPEVQETAELAAFLVSALPCPVAVSQGYAGELDCPVFLSPVPHHTTLGDHLAPWQGRELWLDTALDGEIITLTEKGTATTPLPPGPLPAHGHREPQLHCHYQIELSESQAGFTLWRTREDLEALLEEAEGLGVKTAVGLFQELG